MRLLAHRADDVAVSLHLLEIESLLAVCREVELLALADPGLDRLAVEARLVRDDLAELVDASPYLSPRGQGRSGGRRLGLLPQGGLQPCDERLSRMVARLGPLLAAGDADTLEHLWCLGAWAPALHALVRGLRRAGVRLTLGDEDELMILGERLLADGWYRADVRACSSRPARALSGGPDAAPAPRLTGRRLALVETVAGVAQVRLSRGAAVGLQSMVELVDETLGQTAQELPGHQRRGIAELRGELGVLVAAVDGRPMPTPTSRRQRIP